MNSDVWLYHCLLFLPAAKPTGQWMQSVGVGVGVGVGGNIELQENAWTDRCKTYQDVYFFTRNLMA